MIELKNIEKKYGKGQQSVTALANINLKIKKGEMIAIMGTSGSGKSSLLNLIGCIDEPTAGNYFLEGQSIGELNKAILGRLRNQSFGFVLQYFALIEEMTVYDNVKLPLDYAKVKRGQKKAWVIKSLSALDVVDKLKRFPSELSGGEAQRVAISRAIVNSPNIILADEPTGSLDEKNSQQVMAIFQKFHEEGKTLIIVTHDQQIANYCQRIIHLEDGKII